MRTIAIINQKGGCGKTTTSINLAAVMAAKGRKTLLVDMDPQAHCALGLAVPEAQVGKSITDMLRAGLDGSLAFSDVVWQIARNFDLAPATMALAALEQELSHLPDKDRRLAQILSTVSDQYEFCIIDCPPSIGLLTFNALRAADEIVVPVETGYFALQGSIKQQATIQMLTRRINHHARFWVLATMYDVRTKLAREILGELKRHFGEQLLPVVVHFNSKLKEAASFGQPITEYDPVSRGCEDFDQLANWLISNPPAPVQQSPAMVTANPALSRAAELVERARALQARTAALSAKLSPGSAPGTSAPEIPGTLAPGIPGIPGIPGNFATAAGNQASAFEHFDESTVDARSASSPAAPSLAPAASTPTETPARSTPFIRPASPINPPTVSALELPSAEAVTAAVNALTNPAPQPDAQSANRSILNVLSSETRPATPNQPTYASRLAKLFGVRHTTQGLLFVQPVNGSAALEIAGDFNDWNPQHTPMRRDDQLGVWQACVPLSPGKYRYRLVVDGQWVQDPYNPQVETNPFGQLNNFVEIK